MEKNDRMCKGVIDRASENELVSSYGFWGVCVYNQFFFLAFTLSCDLCPR